MFRRSIVPAFLICAVGWIGGNALVRAGQTSLVLPANANSPSAPAPTPSPAPSAAAAKESPKPLLDEATLRTALWELPSVYDLPARATTDEGGSARFARACARLSARLHLSVSAVEQELPKFAKHVADRSDLPPQEQALGWFALRQFAKAEALARQAAGPASLPSAPKSKDAAQALELAGRSAAQQGLFDRALEAYRGASALLGESNETARLALQRDVALVYTATDRLEEAEKLWRQLVAAHLAVGVPQDPEVSTARQGLAGLLVKRGRYAEAALLYREELDALEHRKNADPDEMRMLRQSYIRAMQSQATSAPVMPR